MHETEEEQVEAIRNWWRENGRAVVAGIVIGLASLFGWNYWQDHREGLAERASGIYAEVTGAIAVGGLGEAARMTDELYRDYSSTPYADLAALRLAQASVEHGDLDAAATLLRDLAKNARQRPLRGAAALRLARVLHAQGRHDEALATIDGAGLSPAWTVLVEELRGDIYRTLGDNDLARAAYHQAIASVGGDAPDHLLMKRDAVASPPATGSDG